MMDVEFWAAVLAGGIRLATPLGLAALGELIGERAGVLNLGVEGTMALGAVAGVIAADQGGWPLGLAGGMLVGALVGALFGHVVVRRGADQIVVGFALALGGVGLAAFVYRSLYAAPPAITPASPWEVPGLSELPVLGEALFAQAPLVWLLPVAAVAAMLVFARTQVGLRLRAVGDDPASAAARGVSPVSVRLWASVAAGALGGLGGATLSVGIVGEFSDQIIGGRGFLALALVIIAGWRPLVLLPVVYLVGALQSFQLQVQTAGVSLPVELLQALPFVVTLLILAAGVGAAQAPRGLGTAPARATS